MQNRFSSLKKNWICFILFLKGRIFSSYNIAGIKEIKL